MTLKKRIAINIAFSFSILFGIAALVIYVAFSTFRTDEFKNRLNEKALTTAKLLVEVTEIDKQLLKLIDRNTINKLYNEKTLVFDKNFKLIYSSIDDASIGWKLSDLKHLKKHKTFFKVENEKDLFGTYFSYQNAEYYVLIAAEDIYGNNKIDYLLYILLSTFLTSTLLVWLSTYFFIKKLLHPLDKFQEQITTISVNKLNVKLIENETEDEISILTKAFNQLLFRLEIAFESQKEFTSNASHEIKTPLTRIAFQIENLLQIKNHSPETIFYLKNMHTDVYKLSDVVNSLLLLSKINNKNYKTHFQPERIDEIIFKTIEELKKYNPNFEFEFEISENVDSENDLIVRGVKSLLEIVCINLLKNACFYSIDNKAKILLKLAQKKQLEVEIQNKGTLLSPDEQNRIFDSFMRGANSSSISGSGLGLRITKRILDYHNFSITYKTIEPNTNCFTILFN